MTKLVTLEWVGVTGNINFGDHRTYASVEDAMADDGRRGMGIWYLVAETSPKESNLSFRVLAEKVLSWADCPVWFGGSSAGDQALQVSFSGDGELLDRIWKLLAL